MGTKIYDYLAAKRLIIFCFQNDESALDLKRKFFNYNDLNEYSRIPQIDLIKKTNSGIIVQDSLHLKKVLIDLHKIFIKKKSIACNSKEIQKYSRSEQARLLSEILNNFYPEKILER